MISRVRIASTDTCDRVVVFSRRSGIEIEIGVLEVYPGDGVELALRLLGNPLEIDLDPRSDSVIDLLAVEPAAEEGMANGRKARVS